MTNEQKLFIEIIKDFINNNVADYAEKFENLDFSAIYRYARIHDLLPLIYKTCPSNIPEKYVDECKNAFYNAIKHNAETKSFINSLPSDSPYFIVKGPSVAEYYPYPFIRQMGDIDVVAKDRVAFSETLQKMGFDVEQRDFNADWHCKKGNVLVELHDRLIYAEDNILESYSDFFNDFEPYFEQKSVDRSFNMLFCIVHMRKHLLNYGVGFRFLMDIACLSKYDKNIDWTFVSEKLTEFKLYSFASRCFRLCEYLFDVKAPLECESVEENELESLTERVFESGTFGFNNADGIDGGIARVMLNKNVSFGKAKLIYLFKRLFVPADVISSGEKYKYVGKNKLLVPFAWLRRFAKKVFDADVWKRFFKTLFTSKKSTQSRIDTFQNWGL